MKFDLKRLQEVVKPIPADAMADAAYREQNRDWLKKSALIALDIHAYLRRNGISKQEFAQMLGVSPAQVTKLLSGRENLGLKTICKIESVLSMDLITIPDYEHDYLYQNMSAGMMVSEDIAPID